MAAPASTGKIDRQTTTPFLLRLFYKNGSFHRLEDFSPDTRLPQHLQIYTWPDCSISELTKLVASALAPSFLPPPYTGTRVAFRMVFADMQSSRPGRYTSRELGSVVIGSPVAGDEDAVNTDSAGVPNALSNLNGEPNKTLADGRFVIGDFISCAILPPNADGSAQPAPATLSRDMGRGPLPRGGFGGGRGAGGRENGFGGRGGFGYSGGGGRGSGLPSGEWRRGEAPPASEYWRGGGGGPRRARGRGGW